MITTLSEMINHLQGLYADFGDMEIEPPLTISVANEDGNHPFLLVEEDTERGG